MRPTGGIFLHSRKAAACTVIAMQAPERARSMAARAARPTSSCLAAEPLCGTPGRGDFWFQTFGASPPASTGRTEQGHGCCGHRGGGEGAQAEEAQGAIPYERNFMMSAA